MQIASALFYANFSGNLHIPGDAKPALGEAVSAISSSRVLGRQAS